MHSTSDRVRVAIIGAGIGKSHIKGYKQVPEAEIVGLCDLNLDRARQVAATHDLEGAAIFADYRAMLEDVEIDAVSLCLPNLLHAPVAIDCLSAGKHLICEKPLAMNAVEARAIADAAHHAGRKCMVGQVNRFRADSRYLKQVVEGGGLGRIYYAHAGWLRKRGIPHLGGWFTTQDMSGGGALIDIGVHLLDMAWWLAGCPQPLAASGSTYAEFGPRGLGSSQPGRPDGTCDVEDLAVGLVRFAGGLTINLEVSWALHSREDSETWVQIYGSEGGCEWGDPVGVFTDVAGQAAVSRISPPKLDPWKGEMQHFIECILHDTTPDPDVEQGVQMMQMLDALYESARTGHEVVIN